MAKCKYDGCKKYSTYGDKGGKPTYCKIHKTPEMIDIINKNKICIEI
jgi:hypothetical protein